MEDSLNQIFLALISLLTTVILAALGEIRGYALRWLKTKRIASEREYLQKIAEEGFAIVEQGMKGMISTGKLNIAIEYVSRQLRTAGIDMEPEAIRAAVEKAVTEYNRKKYDKNSNG